MWCLKKVTVWSQFSVKNKKPCSPPLEAETFQQEFIWTFARDEYQVKGKGLLYLHGVLFPFFSCQKVSTQMQMWGLQRKTSLKSIWDLIHVLWKSRHFMSTCPLWLYSKSSYSAEQELSQFVEYVWVYCYSCEYVHVCFFIWNPSPLFMQKAEMEQRSGEVNFLVIERYNKF